MTEILTGKSPFKEQAQALVNDSGVTEASEQILGPFSELAAMVADSLWDALFPSAQTNSLYWPYLLVTLVCCVALWAWRKGRGAKGADGRERAAGFWEYLFPRGIYTHRSARVDVGLYMIDALIYPLWVLAFLGALAPALEQGTISVLQWVFGASPALQKNALGMLCYGLVTLLAVDFMFFITHWLLHRYPILWAIHKVHHSAEVLTPLTRYREHFLAAPIWAAGSALAYAVPAGIFAYLFNGGLTAVTLVGVSVFSFLYAITGNLRHHHVSLRFPRWLEHWLQSPAMHHTHHSVLEKHWGTNLGLLTSIWDRLFGSLYIPADNEETPWGLPPQDQVLWSSLGQNLTGPFREINAIVRSHVAGANSVQSPDDQ